MFLLGILFEIRRHVLYSNTPAHCTSVTSEIQNQRHMVLPSLDLIRNNLILIFNLVPLVCNLLNNFTSLLHSIFKTIILKNVFSDI